jgi:hypothetical protein
MITLEGKLQSGVRTRQYIAEQEVLDDYNASVIRDHL